MEYLKEPDQKILDFDNMCIFPLGKKKKQTSLNFLYSFQ